MRLLDEARQLLITRRFFLARFQPQRRGVARRQFDIHQRARVPNHHIAHQIAHPVAVRGHTRFAARHIARAKFLFRFEDARFEQRQQIVKFDQRILHRRRRKQQQEAFVERVDELPVGGHAVFQMMRFVHDHQVVMLLRENFLMLSSARRGNRSDHARLRPEGLRVAADERIVARGKRHVELGRHLFLPLPDQRCRSQHEYAFGHPAQQIFFQHHPRFNCFAQSDFIRQQHAPAKLLEDFAHGFDLIPVRVNLVQRRQAEQFIEALQQA